MSEARPRTDALEEHVADTVLVPLCNGHKHRIDLEVHVLSIS